MDKEIKQELYEKVENEILATHFMTILSMMLTPSKDEEAREKASDENRKNFKALSIKIVELVLSVQDAGNFSKKEGEVKHG